MGFLDKAKKAATKAVDQHGDKIRKAQGQAKVQLDKLDGKNDDLR